MENEEVEIELDTLRDEWNEMSLRDKYQIVEQVLSKR